MQRSLQFNRFVSGVALIWLACACVFQIQARNEPHLSFNRDIRPILSDHCLNCHGPDAGTRKADLRLDLREDALKGGKSGKPAIVPCDPAASELIARITTHDQDDVMPPLKTGKTVSPKELAALKKWIEQGAEFQAHWAFIPPQRLVEI